MRSGNLVFSFHNAALRRNGTLLAGSFNLDVHAGESWWICGANGSGKTTLLETIAGHQRLAEGEMILPGNSSADKFYASVVLVRRDFSLYSMFNRSASFYQQRYFSIGVEETPAVIDFVEAETGFSKEKILEAATALKVDCLLDKHIVSLSTGEGRRILLLLLYLKGSYIICFDDPYSGLDPEGKELVSHAMTILLEKKMTILLTSVDTNPPGFISHVLYLANREVAYKGKTRNFRHHENGASLVEKDIRLKRHVPDEYNYGFRIAAEIKNITIRYDNTIVQKDFSWKINQGDKWILTGPNGSGKSTLMSLIYGDNPMAYAYELVVFDRVRGTGETIWDIKRPMGYFSSELQQFFPLSMTFYEAVLSGFSDHLVVRDDLTREHHLQASGLIDAAGMTEFENIPLFKLSFSQCRLALVCRALVKLPPVVILDEPCQGLDPATTKTVNRLIDMACENERKTLIYITHQFGEVPKVINRRLELRKS
jgi:molybdate transport system ATP-binding protein